ncbi:uncharacterized protein DUF4157 [Krasilnikovia cinnamomea]|uniref:Uncharacterized protein DUF4157 n=1 Tax=Krasilnikovia cinnamomea TaxID=349313 RepID=A0A4Q7ZES7_9ACTN|nr:DUF4157 domain-containing protein [Krasilnikovia cinnamomea]RZU48469.1 uncharacterized protein DUF4157 [Krasilnikovia cinnamomea]
MASAPASERRPRTLRRVVRRLFTDRWAGRRRAPGPRVGADLAATLPVRASWSLLRWWRRWRPRHTGPAPAPTGREIGAAPVMLRDSPARSRAVAGRGTLAPLGTPRPPLTSGPATGPDVRPGHELTLRPAFGTRGDRRDGDAGIVRSLHSGASDSHPHPWADVGAGAPYREGPLGVRPVLARAGATGGPGVLGAGPGRGGDATDRTGGAWPVRSGDAASSAAGRGTGSSGRAVPGTGPGLVTGLRPLGRAGSLTARPGPGPSVRNPESAADLRVLGGGPQPPGTGPDMLGAVTTLRPDHGRGLIGGYGMPVPEKPGSERPGSGRPRSEKPGSEKPGSEKSDPRARWEAAVAARPLEAPRPLPGALHAMASALTGRAHPPLFTTGPATRHALAAAGARGATTGTVVHLPEAPANVPVMSEVLAHELTHTRSPVRRPRFLLEHAAGLLDDDERQALSAGRQRLADAGQGLLSAGRDRLAEAAPSAAGIVDQLPVGGGLGAVGDVATRAARAAVLEATSGPMSGLTGAVGDARDAASGALASAGGLAAEAASGVTGAVDAAAGAVSGAAGQAAATVAGAASGAAGAAKAALDPDKVVEIVEARLLREIERRGGRWAGVF